jgi:hypothetical protein
VKTLENIILGVLVFLNILFWIILACTSLKEKQSYFEHLRKMDITYQGSEENIVPNQNFIFLKKYLYKDLDDINCDPHISEETAACKPTDLYTTASGIAIGYENKKVKILTAAHWCFETLEDILFNLDKDEHGELIEPTFYYEADFYGKTYKAKVIDIDLQSDLCMLSIRTEYANQTKKVKVAKYNPNIGDNVYSISAPQSVGTHKTRFHFHGNFAGCDEAMIDMPFCFYTLPAAPGSSGSGIFNIDGDLISILSITIRGFEHLSGGPSPYEIENFLNRNKCSEL